ncbi:hypothetical protein [Prosthecobacter sp.]|jgi:hypothetical protein|uniref:hypothetical protein n=1 Tax=Prosthecobacter sp. TaxID=1965333 RepID=UPI0037836BA5
MRFPLALLSLLLAFSLLSAEEGVEEFVFPKDELNALIRETAAKIEERFKSEHAEAEGLVRRVEEILALPSPVKPDEGDRPRWLASKLTLVNAQAGFNSSITGVRGAIFDDSEIGHLQRYHDQEHASAKDAAEVWRWLEMAQSARHLKWKDKEQMCEERAIGAARAFISREPKNALAHAMLGVALDWGAEKFATLKTALKLDSQQLLASYAMLDRRVDLAFESAVLRREISMDEKARDVQELYQALFAHALTDEERNVWLKQQDGLRREVVALLKLAHEKRDLTVFLKAVGLLNFLPLQQTRMMLASKRGADDTFQNFEGRMHMAMMEYMFSVFRNDELLAAALDLASDDPESMGAVLLIALVGDGMHVMRDQQRPSKTRDEILGRTLKHLLDMAAADESLRAAHAAEAAFMMECAMSMLRQRGPEHMELLLRAIKLDPFRLRTQKMLAMACMGMPGTKENKPAAVALMQTQLALMPNLQTRRMCAGAMSMLEAWPEAHKMLDDCLKEKPDDLGLLNQKAVTYLRENQSRATQKKVEAIFRKMDALRTQSLSDTDKESLKLVTRNHILFLMIGGKNEAAREQLAVAGRDKLLEEKECQELEGLLR